MKRECESCIKRKTPYCPNSTECMATDDMPYYQNRIMLLKENEKLKSQLSGTTFCYDEKEHRDLKAKIKELERIIELCHLDAKETLATINYEQESQQKEFIKFLEDEWAKHEYISAHEIDDNIRHTEEKIRSNIFEILQKYKSVIGVSDENNKQ